MQAHRDGPFLYIYSGRDSYEKNPDPSKVGEKDPFSRVHCIRIDAITSVENDQKNCTVTIWVGMRPIYCSFGTRNCYKINCHGAFLHVLAEALGLSPEMIWDMNKRNEQTALSVQRCDEGLGDDSD
jgi:hypothetical protein